MNLKTSIIPVGIILSLTFVGGVRWQAIAQTSEVEVNSPSVDCDNETADINASAPGVGVSAPNPSRLVPNVGRILREGVGVPAPDSEAPDVGSPRVRVSPTNVKCADRRINTEPSSSQQLNSEQNSTSTQGLW